MQTRKNRIFKNVLSSVIVTLFLVICFFTIIFSVFKITYFETRVVGHSMYPTLNATVNNKEEGDTVYINRFSPYTNGDIVVANAARWGLSTTANTSVHYIIKRLVGCPGDKIKIAEVDGNYLIYVNNEIFYADGEIYSVEKTATTTNYYEKYLSFLANESFADNVTTDDAGDKCILLNEDEYFLMGDNWNVSVDSVTYGVIYKSEMVGRVDIIIVKADRNYFTVFKEIMSLLFA